jgi:hypothetical protein
MKQISKHLLLLLASMLMLAACKKEDEAPIQTTNAFVGTFRVAETSPANGESDYDITITKSSTEPNTIEISNFADVLKKNVKAQVSGETITIPAQVFTSGNMQLTISGAGTLKGNILTYTYVVKGSFNWEATCVSTKK